MKNTLDSFTHAYIQTALWSSTEYAHGKCPCCGRTALLSHYPEPEYEEQAMCASPGCGTREIANPPPMDRHYSESDLAPETLEKVIADCTAFREKADAIISAAIETGEVSAGPDFDEYERAAHDFWLTRNGHGCGFWDGDWPEPMAEQLTTISKEMGECYLYAGDDGKLYRG